MITTYYADTQLDDQYQLPDLDVRRPFFHQTRLTDPDLCYSALGLIRYRTDQTLINGQVAKFSCPAAGWFNQDVEFMLYILLARLREARAEIGKFEIAMAADPGPGNSTLSTESDIYIYRADSVFGFLGLDADATNPLDVNDVIDMVSGDTANISLDFVRRADGALPFMPKFYREMTAGDDATYAFSRYDVVERRWLMLVETPGLLLPFVKKSDSFDSERRLVESRMTSVPELRWGSSLYVGTTAFTPAPGSLSPLRSFDDPMRAEVEQAHMTRDHMNLTTYGLYPGWQRLPRTAGPDRIRHTGLRRILNANGVHTWDKQVLGLK